MSTHVAIRADGGNKIGLGHIVRTMALANECKRNNCSVVFITQDNPIVVKMLTEKGFIIEPIPLALKKDEELRVVNHIMNERKTEIFIGDCFAIDREYVLGIRKNNRFIVMLDNLKDMSLGADLIINGAIYGKTFREEAEKYQQKALLGDGYYILREQFIQNSKRVIHKNVHSILVTMGGSDPLNLTPWLMKMIHKVDHSLKINVVVGSAFEHATEIQELAQELSNITLHVGVENMANLMEQSDIAISAGGVTPYELAATGTPSIVVIQAENQVLSSTMLADKEIVINLGDGAALQENVFINTLKQLIENYGQRKTMSALGQQTVDGRGVMRCVAHILESYREKR
jgi:UDP-2,4-diacetamido-2,4,6-trideoxy-beta-L-altropyranose hydrolase